jgi:hypothetical protein
MTRTWSDHYKLVIWGYVDVKFDEQANRFSETMYGTIQLAGVAARNLFFATAHNQNSKRLQSLSDPSHWA